MRRVSILAGLLAVLCADALPAMADVDGSAVARLSAPQRLEIDGAVIKQFQKCWVPTFGPQSVTVRFELNRDGSLAVEPSVVEAKLAGASAAEADAAVQAVFRAVRKCAPIALPSEAFDYWRQVKIKFNAPAPARLFGASPSPQ